jgi:glutathione synthase/RimK-type ligase-like ATP-grasp enzyme
MIVLLTNKYDISTDYVVKVLHSRNMEFLRLNTEDLIDGEIEITLPIFSTRIQQGCKKLSFSDVHAVLFRRPGKPFEFEMNSQPSTITKAYVENQWHVFLESLCNIEGIFWINNPINNHISENKILQLKRAVALGFNIPRTCITSSKKSAELFFEECKGRIIAKALFSPLLEYSNDDYFIYTTLVEQLDEIPVQEFQIAPTIFQEAFENKVDYRVTIIGSSCFAVKIESIDGAQMPIDWRLGSKKSKYLPVILPNEIVQKCINLVKDLKLVFGAIDLIEVNHQFYFLEINPNGEWGWLQKEANLPIAEALVDSLMEGRDV